MPRYIITLGSNVDNRFEMVDRAIGWLKDTFAVVAATDVYSSPDASAHHGGRSEGEDATAPPPYANAIVVVDSADSADELDRRFKDYEASQGRDRLTRAVPIDVDAVVCDTNVLRMRDYTAPYFILGLPKLHIT